ncbi:MAG: ABC transporter ATP-binding protein [Robiginitalea sp.]|uniref:ABC transporter ATP-binding protein n=1 Tax=Robiginitalea sp. TaxID=1902411 RepID=UPI003C73319E
MILDARDVRKSYGSLKVLKGVSLGLNHGEICGLIGPNGAGKSTLFRILLGLVSRDSGTLNIHSDAAKPLGGIIEKPALYGYLSAYENLRVFARIQKLKLSPADIESQLSQVGLSPSRKDPVRNYSMGMKQRLGLAIALLNEPECVILDEPFSGLDPMGIRTLQDEIRELAKARGIGILISSHNLVELGDLCDRLYVINKGEIIREGPTREILQQAARSYVIYGTGLESTRVLGAAHVEYRTGSVLLHLEEDSIHTILQKLSAEPGVNLTACVPQTNLAALFEKTPE